MLFIPISATLLSVAIFLSWASKNQHPFQVNWIGIALFALQVIAFIWLVDLQRSIGCPTLFGECYTQHDDLLFLQSTKLLFGVTAWLFWGYLFALIFVRIFSFFKKIF